MESYIELKQIKIHAYHGVDKQERIVGNDYLVRVKVKFDITKAAKSDSVSDTINYADIYDVVKCEMSTPSNLLENVVYRIMKAIKQNFPLVEGGEIEIVKIKPPIAGDVTGATVSISFQLIVISCQLRDMLLF